MVRARRAGMQVTGRRRETTAGVGACTTVPGLRQGRLKEITTRREAMAIPTANRACIPARSTDMTTAVNLEATPRAESPAFTVAVAVAAGSAADMAAVADTTKNLFST